LGDRDDLRSTADVELPEDVGDVDAGSALRDEELLGDLAVARAAAEQREHIAFARR
jgi:hypothetical protein